MPFNRDPSMSDTKIAQLLRSAGTHRVLLLADGSVIERSGGTASWRNNNPGNLKFEFSASADPTTHAKRTREQALAVAQARYNGIVDLDQWGNAVFETPQAGRAAQIQLLRSRFGHQTVEQMVQGYSTTDYSGATHHAQQAAAIHRVAQAAGSDLHGKAIGALTRRELDALADGIGHFEGFKIGEVRVLSRPTLQAARDGLPGTPAGLRVHGAAGYAPRGHADVAPVVGPHATARAGDVPRPATRDPRAHGHEARHVAAGNGRNGDAQAPHLHASLHPGAHGARVRELQAALNRLGYGDAQGHRLLEDGHYGHHTRDAVVAFQAAHALPSAGVAGPRTQAALRHADAQLVNSPVHPDHRLFVRVLHQLRVAAVERGITPDLHDERIAGALLVQMRRDGIEHVDRVEINRDGSRLRAIWVSPLRDEPGLNRTSCAIDLHRAAEQSLRASSEQLVHAGLAAAVQEHQLARQHSGPRQPPPQPRLAAQV
jgi:hypothetical protein